MVINVIALIFFVIWLVIGIVTAVMVVRGMEVPKGTFFCALLIVLMYYLEKALGV